ncbi:hypothetical protein CXG81DRAFT_26911 [Caulochytrium protostelioides]|nr:hypothetical protein CXG81DRAFT_26911 [Caulochytrium protostelioides]|eukprot:RKP00382.1 hypothetical protein CXG81DRAFT_26911 [Caulochytrium protostelioides]
MLLVGIALTAYFLFPHVPTFEVQNVVPSTNPKAAASMKSSDPSGANAFSVTNTGSGVQVALALSMVLEVDNPNPYAITIDSMVMQAAIQPNATYLKHNALFTAAAATRLTQKPSIPIGTGKTGEQRFAGKTKTSFAVGFRIVYAVATDGSAADDPVLLEIVDACGLSSGSSPRMMRIAYTADVRIGVLKAFGVGAVTLQDSFRVSCPFTTAQISQILTQGGTLSSLLNSLHLDM